MRGRRPNYHQPFRATPIKLGKVYRARQNRARWIVRAKAGAIFAAVLALVFTGGMVATNWPAVRAAIVSDQPTAALVSDKPATVQFSNCGTFRRNCVIDGDTFKLDGRKVRIADIDTPEISEPKCQSEYDRGMRAKHRLRELLSAGAFDLQPIPGRDTDQYGRQLRVVVRDGRSIGDQLVSEGLARTWTGRREPWCIS